MEQAARFLRKVVELVTGLEEQEEAEVEEQEVMEVCGGGGQCRGRERRRVVATTEISDFSPGSQTDFGGVM